MHVRGLGCEHKNNLNYYGCVDKVVSGLMLGYWGAHVRVDSRVLWSRGPGVCVYVHDVAGRVLWREGRACRLMMGYFRICIRYGIQITQKHGVCVRCAVRGWGAVNGYIPYTRMSIFFLWLFAAWVSHVSE
jgi:hypothetical protein